MIPPFLIKPLLIAAAVVALIAAAFLIVHTHDARIRTQDAAKVAVAEAAQRERDTAAAIKAEGDAATADRTRTIALTEGRLELKNGTNLDDPALAAALHRLLAP